MSPEQPGLTVLDAPGGEDARRRRYRRPPAADNGDAGASRRGRQPIVARRVRRVVRHLDPWAVLKVGLVFYLCCYVVAIVAGVLLWTLAERAELVDKVESLVEELGAYRSFEFLPDRILVVSLLAGAVLVVVATGLTVLAAVFFNLISDLVGGIRVIVLEEDSARPRPPATGSVTDSEQGFGPVGSTRVAATGTRGPGEDTSGL